MNEKRESNAGLKIFQQKNQRRRGRRANLSDGEKFDSMGFPSLARLAEADIGKD
jgi:hypothetical protein